MTANDQCASYKEAIADIKSASAETQHQMKDLVVYKKEYTDQV